MSEAQSFAVLKQMSTLKQTGDNAHFSPLDGPHPANQIAASPERPTQVLFDESRVLQQMLKNIVTQSEVNTALVNRLLELEKRIALLEDRVHSLIPKS